MLNPVTPNFEAQLRGMLPQAAFKDPAPYLSEPRGRWTGQGLVVAPSSTEEVAAVVKACAQAGVGIVPFSGGTGFGWRTDHAGRAYPCCLVARSHVAGQGGLPFRECAGL